MFAAVLVLACQESLSPHPKVCSSSDRLHFLEYRLRCPGIDLSAPSVALFGLSMALGERHVVLDGLPLLQKRVSAVSDLTLSVVLVDRATRMLLVWVCRAEVVLWILLSHCLSWFLYIELEQRP